MELRILTDFIKTLNKYDDVRPYIDDFFKIKVYGDYDTPEQAIEAIYGVVVEEFM